MRTEGYLGHGQKAPAAMPMYRCTGVEIVRGRARITSALAALGAVRCLDACLPAAAAVAGAAAGGARQQLPTTILVHFQVPFLAGPLFGEHDVGDAGCSALLRFEIQPWAHEALSDLENAPVGIRLLVQYFQERGHPFAEGRDVSRCFKAIGIFSDVDALNVPPLVRRIVRQFQGKPVLIEKESVRFVSVAHSAVSLDVVEIAVDIRGFNPFARSVLCRFRHELVHTSVQLGLMLQGCSDHELPEALLGCVELQGIDLENCEFVDMPLAAIQAR
eukprot:CAMPEP_0198492796 /NCGR_PEP_ID=MMETSP1462-20131121/3615_1 /TAXON_ID=1333877 /ORGANISM="Brandtodinium nutriculum, Strain RCC3387" /LENGTH=273 /DNA_ID=CAMNT_0044221445 /DNA_START=72 /DNA_END=889 /DNA_ORIENTATION=-